MKSTSTLATVAKYRFTAQKGRVRLKWLWVVLVLFAVLFGGAWIWSGSNGSLAQGISLAQRFLGPGKLLSATDVQGSLRHGGHIGTLRWQQDGMEVELADVDLTWQFLALLRRQLVIEHLRVDQIRIVQNQTSALVAGEQSDTQSETQTHRPSTVSTPPQKIELPLRVNLQQLQVNRVLMARAIAAGESQDSSRTQEQGDTVVASNIALSYQFDGSDHQLDISSLQVGMGSYTGRATLRAKDPLLDAQLSGVLIANVPQTGQNVTLNVEANAQGLLTQLGVQLNAQADVQQNGQNAGMLPSVELTATVTPWAVLKVPQADLTLASLNAHEFWPQAPETLLSGTASISTHGEGDALRTEAVVDIRNSVTGAFNQSKLPFSALNGNLSVAGAVVNFERLHAVIGRGAIDITGHYYLPVAFGGQAFDDAWQTVATLEQVDPKLLLTTLATDAVSGTVKVSSTQATPQTLLFDVNLDAAHAANIAQFGVRHVAMQGNFLVNDRILFNMLLIQTASARIEGHGTTYGLHSCSANGPLKLTAPGLQADIVLECFGPRSGTAHISLDVQLADPAKRWLELQPWHLSELVGFLTKISQYTENVANYTQDVPVIVEGGWENPRVRLNMDTNAIITRLAQEQIRRRLPRADGSSSIEQQVERGLADRLGSRLRDRLSR